VALGVLLGVGLTQWPYRDDCGWRLLGYGAAVSVMLLVAGWCAITTWRHRTGVAHAVSLVMGFWGIVLAAEILLPRIGYAAEDATWRCPAPAVVPAPRRGPSALPPAVQQPPSTDDATAQPAEATEPAPGETPTPPDSTGG
jgi:hypothetical protein